MVRTMIYHEFVDKTGTDTLHVDGLAFQDVGAEKIQQLLGVVDKE